MKVVEPSYAILASCIPGLPDNVHMSEDKPNPMVHIERVGRACYKSEDRITEESAPKFIKMLFERKHFAMLEHWRFIVEVTPIVYNALRQLNSKYITMTNFDRCVISFNARGLAELTSRSVFDKDFTLPCGAIQGVVDELIWHTIREYDCYELFGKDRNSSYPLSTGTNFLKQTDLTAQEFKYHGWMSIEFTVDRGISHEIVRHRDNTSFAQESTRYCNYGKDKFGSEITVVDQGFDKGSTEYAAWEDAMQVCEDRYMAMLENGISPQMARSVLPTCLKTTIIMTAPAYEWEHFFNLRALGKTGAPHPQMLEVASELYDFATTYSPEWEDFLLRGEQDND